MARTAPKSNFSANKLLCACGKVCSIQCLSAAPSMHVAKSAKHLRHENNCTKASAPLIDVGTRAWSPLFQVSKFLATQNSPSHLSHNCRWWTTEFLRPQQSRRIWTVRPPGVKYTGSMGTKLFVRMTCVGPGSSSSKVGTVCTPISTLVVLGIAASVLVTGCAPPTPSIPSDRLEADDCRSYPLPPASDLDPGRSMLAAGMPAMAVWPAPSTSLMIVPLGLTAADPLEFVCHRHGAIHDTSHSRLVVPHQPLFEAYLLPPRSKADPCRAMLEVEPRASLAFSLDARLVISSNSASVNVDCP